jgi:F-type H+-transporting ATPase subunit delta
VSSGTTGATGLAGRYATALFELADQEKSLDQVAQDLRQLAGMIRESKDLQRALRSPVISRQSQGKAMAALLDKAGASTLTKRFVGVVAENRRLFTLPDIIDSYLALLAGRRGEISAEVTSAQPLNDGQLGALKAALKKAMGAEIAVNAKVDPGLLGGLIVRLGSRMVDSSLRTKLQRLRLAMRGVA